MRCTDLDIFPAPPWTVAPLPRRGRDATVYGGAGNISNVCASRVESQAGIQRKGDLVILKRCFAPTFDSRLENVPLPQGQGTTGAIWKNTQKMPDEL